MGCLLNKYQEIFYGVNKERIKQSNLKGYTFFKKFVVNLKEKKKTWVIIKFCIRKTHGTYPYDNQTLPILLHVWSHCSHHCCYVTYGQPREILSF